jgi:hypothetical protein
MRKLCISFFVLLLILAVSPAYSQFDVGLSWTPVPGEDSSRDQGGGVDSIVGMHLGWNPWFILYVSWDSLVMPNTVISGMTGYYDEENDYYVDGYYAPGFLNMYDFGIMLKILPFIGTLQIGTNNIYVYQQGIVGGFGANMKVGLGLRFDFWGIMITGTSVFSSMEKLVSTFQGLGNESTRQWAVQELTSGLVPSIVASIYF